MPILTWLNSVILCTDTPLVLMLWWSPFSLVTTVPLEITDPEAFSLIHTNKEFSHIPWSVWSLICTRSIPCNSCSLDQSLIPSPSWLSDWLGLWAQFCHRSVIKGLLLLCCCCQPQDVYFTLSLPFSHLRYPSLIALYLLNLYLRHEWLWLNQNNYFELASYHLSAAHAGTHLQRTSL